ncbi:hypothetical protein SDC9_211385 [bioreactor metagenome]|uniref:Uncharacterized protein n=1 Tax=bioreactor metagenome TaxID=1076179 RepID=A0A645JJ31_9ZZZZ
MVDRVDVERIEVGAHVGEVESGRNQLHSGAVLPGQVVESEFAEVVVGDYIDVELHLGLRHRFIQRFQQRQERFSL